METADRSACRVIRGSCTLLWVEIALPAANSKEQPAILEVPVSFFPALYGHKDVLVALLNALADPTAAAAGFPLLFAAATMGHTQIMQELLDRNVNPNVRSTLIFLSMVFPQLHPNPHPNPHLHPHPHSSPSP